MEPDIIRLPEVSRTTGLARSTVYLRIEQGLLPKPVSLGGKAVGWPASEISQINAELNNIIDKAYNNYENYRNKIIGMINDENIHQFSKQLVLHQFFMQEIMMCHYYI